MSFIEGLVGFCGMGAVENCRQVFCRVLQDASSVLYRFDKGDEQSQESQKLRDRLIEQCA